MKSQFVKLALSLTILLISLLLISCTNRRRETFTSGSVCYGTSMACESGTIGYRKFRGTCYGGANCLLGDPSCYGTLDACNASVFGYRSSQNCTSGSACIGETGCYGTQSECLARPIKPRPTDIQDCGYSNKPRGWADIQGQGVPNDYCRMVGDGNNPYFSCYLAGSTSQLNHDATKPPNNPNPLPALVPLVSTDVCYSR